jgi:hypothetical protein
VTALLSRSRLEHKFSVVGASYRREIIKPARVGGPRASLRSRDLRVHVILSQTHQIIIVSSPISSGESPADPPSAVITVTYTGRYEQLHISSIVSLCSENFGYTKAMAQPMKLAVIGGGPSAFYVASRLLSLLPAAPSSPALSVHLYDRLWAPHGLVRYGVAPDHPEVKVSDGPLPSSCILTICQVTELYTQIRQCCS